ncbi:CHAT domain-containing protein [Phormidesmis sp. 146-35]
MKTIFWFVTALLANLSFGTSLAIAQIISAPDGTGTIITPQGDRYDIKGGQLSRDGANLFHSFTQLDLDRAQVANFLTNPSIQNVLGRVTNGNPSIINGLLQVSGGNTNLFLMNPGGIVFGANASLNLSGSFTATTASAIAIGSNWFNASGMNDYSSLIGTPSYFAFTMSQPSAIINASNLSVGTGQTLTLLGGTIISTGTLVAPQGKLVVATVPGNQWVRINPTNQSIGLEIRSADLQANSPQAWTIPIVSLPELLTGRSGNISVDRSGQVQLSNGALPITTGDIVARNLTAQTVILSANRNLLLSESQLTTTGNLYLLANDTVRVRDSLVTPVTVQSQGNLEIRGNQGIDILALNHPITPFRSGGNITLVSNGIISADAHFSAGRRFSIQNTLGQPGTFISLFDPIISSTGDVSFGDYTGAALKVESLGSITTGNITITRPDTSLVGSDPDIAILTSSRALILRAGLSSLVNPPNVPLSEQGTTFTSPGTASSPATITTGTITTATAPSEEANGGTVILNAPGGIRTDAINSFSSRGTGGNISLAADSGTIKTGSLDSSSEARDGGSISIFTNSAGITTGSLDSSSLSGNGGAIAVTTTSGSINTGSIDSSSLSGNGGTVSVNSTSGRTRTGSIDSSSLSGNGGTVSVNTNSGGTTTGSIDSSSLSGNGGTISVNTNSGNINTGSIDSSSLSGNGGTVSLNSISGAITAGSIDISSRSGSTGNITLSSSSGTISSNSITTSTGVVTTFTQGSRTQAENSSPTLPSDVPYRNLPEQVRQSEVTAQSIEQDREKEFRDILGEAFPEKFVESRDIKFALHTIDNQFNLSKQRSRSSSKESNFNTSYPEASKRTAVLYVQIQSDQLQIVLKTSEVEHRATPMQLSPERKTELYCRADLLRRSIEKDFILNSPADSNRGCSRYSQDKYEVHARKLYNWLIAPVEETLNSEGIGTILFSMDRRLRFIPFSMLLDSQGRSLNERFAVSLIPSLSYTDITYTRPTEYQVLAMGVSDDGNNEERPLVGAPAELSLTQSPRFVQQGNPQQNIFINNQFTFANLNARSKERPFRIIHLATHAGFGRENGKSVFYLNFGQGKKEGFREILERVNQPSRSGELAWKDFRVDLLVLSACNTMGAVSDDSIDDRLFLGLPAKAGVKSALTSFWQVNDAGTLILMSEFYRQLKAGRTKAEALRQVQLSLKNGTIDFALLRQHLRDLLLKETSHSAEFVEALDRERLLFILSLLFEEKRIKQELQHPYYWSAFTIIGNPW